MVLSLEVRHTSASLYMCGAVSTFHICIGPLPQRGPFKPIILFVYTAKVGQDNSYPGLLASFFTGEREGNGEVRRFTQGH